ncbi:unnamed protein product [Peronospora belbahrii]|uniref:EF-hand domain-containing protein n=1 Tax=Peronospora belbahrii TaxID=622444 RepID=A0AAU9LAJ3_9STRA|nr:unnamed protein product [Peronospora belbahrii]
MAGGSLFQVGEDVEFWRVLVHLSVLALSLVLLEKALHRMEHQFPRSEKYQHMLKKVYRELMILGLISLGLKIVKETPFIDSGSKTVLAFQVADLTIFFLALALILQTIAVFQLLRNQNDRVERAELLGTQDLIEMVKDAGTWRPSWIQALFSCTQAAKKTTNGKKLVKLRLLRRLFLRRFGFPQLFPFSNYLNRAQASQISHMIEVEPFMWVILLVVAWVICGIFDLLEAVDTEMPARQELVEAFMLVAWILLLLHVMVFFYLRSCVSYLLQVAAFSDDKMILIQNLNAVAREEAEAWKNEEADKALEIMSCIQEQHEEIEFQRVKRQRKLHREACSIQAFLRQVTGLTILDSITKKSESYNGVVPGSPSIDVHLFSYERWHVCVIFLLVLNGFLITLFLQCAVYDLDEIYRDFGVLPTALVPLPLVLNAFFFQRHIFYDFVIVSSMLRIDSHTLSDVVENFSEVVRLRSEFASSLLHQIAQQELSISDLHAELQLHDAVGSGFIEIDDLRSVLAKFGFCLTRFRFNSVVKLLFDLEGTSVSYRQVVRLVAMAENEDAPVSGGPPHPLLRQSVTGFDGARQPSTLSQSNYSFFTSSRSLPMLTERGLEMDPISVEPMEVPTNVFVLPTRTQGGTTSNDAAAQRPVMARPSYSSQALHGMFNLRRLSDSRECYQL